MTQSEAFDLLKLGHNMYLTGAAGSGKTFLLNKYIAYLRYHKIPVGITASTGIAATHMGGTTIHSWCGMGIKDTLRDADLADIKKRNYILKRFFKTKVLIIDEISMLHAHQLDMVDQICQVMKGIHIPFGGMQIIMCGDFFQLPPVSKQIDSGQVSRPRAQDREAGMTGTKADFVTDSQIWQTMNKTICYLDEQFRQDDRSFLRVLNDIRNGEVSEMTVEYLSERMGKDTKGYSKPTRLFTHNAKVDEINQKHLDELKGDEHIHFMTYSGYQGLVEGLRRNCLAPERLVLKIGAQVMFVKNNFEAGYVNGTLGEVIGFDENDMPKVRTFDGAEITVGKENWEVKEDDTSMAKLSQLPLRLAWAITIHKSQGMSLDAAEVDLSRAFVPGQGYVALSRVRSLNGLKLLGMNQTALMINQDVAALDREFHKLSDDAMIELSGMDIIKKEKMQNDFLKYLIE